MPLAIYVVPLLLIFVIVVAAMAAGWATPTESAALGAVGTVLVAWIYRSLTWSNLMKALMGTAGISGVILFIIVGATTFAQILTFSGATNGLVQAIQQANFAPWAVLVTMMAILLILGCFIDQVSMMLICLPFFMPLVALVSTHMVRAVPHVHATGLPTPPFGMLLFTMTSREIDRDATGIQCGHALRGDGARRAGTGNGLSLPRHLAAQIADRQVI